MSCQKLVLRRMVSLKNRNPDDIASAAASRALPSDDDVTVLWCGVV